MIRSHDPSRQLTAYGPSLQHHRHAGVTLIELLIVVALVVLIAGLTLPSVRGLLKDQRTVQSARVVQGLLESARARAVAMDRPVAAIFERFGVDDADTVGLLSCNRMSIGEVFPPYEGDWANTTGTLVDFDNDGYVDAIDVPASQGASITSLVTDSDYIELGTHKIGFRVKGAPAVNGSTIRVAFYNPAQFTNTVTNALVDMEERRWPVIAGTSNVSFRIYRKPSKTMTSSVLLPRGTSIDLGWSGFGESGTDLALSTPAVTPVKRSIYVVFNPRGAVDSVYVIPPNKVPGSMSTLGLLHFLVGRTDQINLTSNDRVSDRDDVQSNVVDSSNKWVTVNTRNGQVYVSDVGAPDATGTVATARILATNRLTGKD